MCGVCVSVSYECEFGSGRAGRLGRRMKRSEMYVSAGRLMVFSCCWEMCCAPLNAKHNFPFCELTSRHVFCQRGLSATFRHGWNYRSSYPFILFIRSVFCVYFCFLLVALALSLSSSSLLLTKIMKRDRQPLPL